MTIELPPRRALPVEVKERMRPVLTEAPRRNHTPLAVAAAVALLIAGGVAVTQSATEDAVAPARGRVTAPSALDLARCRAALGDEGWRSSEMVVFDGLKVLAGADSRFCELTRSQAFVASKDVAPVRLEAGTVSYLSDRLVAGIPPLGALRTRVRETTGTYSRGSQDSVTTPDFFIAYSPTRLGVTELVFDDRTVPLPQGVTPPQATGTDSFESGDGNPATLENRLARCLDSAAPTAPLATAPGWRPLVSAGFDEGLSGVVVASQDGHPDRYGVCHTSDGAGFGNFTVRSNSDQSFIASLLNVSGTAERQLVAGHVHRDGRTIELTVSGLPTVTVPVVDGFYAAAIPGSGNAVQAGVHAVVRGADNSVLHSARIA